MFANASRLRRLAKRLARMAMDASVPNAVFIAALDNRAFRALVHRIYFHTRGGEAVSTLETRSVRETERLLAP